MIFFVEEDSQEVRLLEEYIRMGEVMKTVDEEVEQSLDKKEVQDKKTDPKRSTPGTKVNGKNESKNDMI